jgi:SNF2 family DNA or RNA helicase
MCGSVAPFFILHTMNYLQFIESKKHSQVNFGIEPISIPDTMFDYQRYVTEHAIRKGRCAVFLDTGLGKTLIQLSVADNYAAATGKPVLIITPLAVAFQFVREATTFGIQGVEYSKDGKHNTRIVVCNYERLDKFKHTDFDCVILDESSILKNFDGAIKNQVTSFLKKVRYRYLFTATPSPNDYIELGTSSEALGYMGYTDMLTKFFSNRENNIKAMDRVGSKFYLKPHAKDAFFAWVSSWSISARKPSDLGFSDEKHVLPELKFNYHSVTNKNNWIVNGQIMMFEMPAQRLTEIRHEQKGTILDRCEKAIEVAKLYEHSVYWCNFNEEGDTLEQMDPNAYQIKGSMNVDQKEEMLLAFFEGEIKKLVTKPKMTAFGLNWQHCNHTVYFPTFSYEQYYQAIRRFWRFGQKRTVNVDLVFSDGQKKVMDSLIAKAESANQLFAMLNANINSQYKTQTKTLENNISLPKFI